MMKEESTLIWVPKEMPLNVVGDGERCIEALTLFTCVMRFGKHWGRNGVSAPEGTSVEGAGVRFARRCRGRGFFFFLFLALGVRRTRASWWKEEVKRLGGLCRGCEDGLQWNVEGRQVYCVASGGRISSGRGEVSEM